MCGILGIVRPPGEQVDSAVARAALQMMRHRGPDDEGYLLVNLADGRVDALRGDDTHPDLQLPELAEYRSGPANILLGHRRLSILDVTSAGHQPMPSPEGRCWILLNGEIYNFLELREELKRAGDAFRTASDTEVVLAAWRRWGPAMLPRLVGMFALAILDLEKMILFLARDPFGIKPLYYSWQDGSLVFASEVKPLLSLRMSRPRGNCDALYQYLRFGFTDFGEDTLFRDIRQVPAAHHLTVSLARPTHGVPVRYWSIDLRQAERVTLREAAEWVRRAFDESVRLHLRSDVPLGVCLSGGVDSSAITLSINQCLGGQKEIHAFSYIADDTPLCEETFVDLVAGCAPVRVHKVYLQPQQLVSELQSLLQAQEFPFMSTSIYAQYKIFEKARQVGVTVMLDGQGADELFAGYYSMIGARLTGVLARGRFGSIKELLQNAPQNLEIHKHRMLVAAFGRLLPVSVRGAFMALVGEPLMPSWLDADWFRRRGVCPKSRPQGSGSDCLRKELKLLIEHLSLPQLLRYEDRNAMRHSIESRVPFCTRELAEVAFSLPEDYLVNNRGITKFVLKEAMRGLVPDAILQREKVGFAVPEQVWAEALTPWIEERFNSAVEFPFFNLKRMNTIREGLAAAIGLGAGPLWRCVNIIEWSSLFGVRWES